MEPHKSAKQKTTLSSDVEAAQPAGQGERLDQADGKPLPANATKPARGRQAHLRFAETFAVLHRRLWFPRRPPAGQIWPRRMDRTVLVGLALILAVAFFDGLAIDHARNSQSTLLDGMRWVTDIGKSQWYLVPAGIVFLAVAGLDWRAAALRGKARLQLILGHAGFTFVAIAGGGVLANVIKVVIGRARPALFDQFGAYHFDPFTPGYLYASFPSGHATTMGGVTAILMLWLPRWRLPIGLAGALLAATRIAADAHYPSDVAAGFLFGALVTVVLARFLASRRLVFRFLPGKIFPATMLRSVGK